MRRLLIAFLLAIILGFAVAKVQGQDEGEIIVYYPGICSVLEKYGYWYYFFACHLEDNNELMAQSVTQTLDSDGTLTTDITRTHKDGSVSWIRRVQRQKGK
jgi:hypothetical protein